MSKNLLYHSLNVVGYRYRKTEDVEREKYKGENLMNHRGLVGKSFDRRHVPIRGPETTPISLLCARYHFIHLRQEIAAPG